MFCLALLDFFSVYPLSFPKIQTCYDDSGIFTIKEGKRKALVSAGFCKRIIPPETDFLNRYVRNVLEDFCFRLKRGGFFLEPHETRKKLFYGVVPRRCFGSENRFPFFLHAGNKPKCDTDNGKENSNGAENNPDSIICVKIHDSRIAEFGTICH